MTDNDRANVFTIFCDECKKSITKNKGEVLFEDVESAPVNMLHLHYHCSRGVEMRDETNYGNMSIADYIGCLVRDYGYNEQQY